MDNLVAQYLEKLRLRLLDLSGRNKLLNFKFSERSRTQVRIVDTLPNKVFEELKKGSSLAIVALPDRPEHPTDEADDSFLLMLEAMRDADEEYKAAVEALDEADQDSEDFQKIERILRDKVREELGMPLRTDVASLSKTDYAQYIEIHPNYELISASQDGSKSSKNLQTLLYANELERKLAGLREGARKSLQETGLNTLYLAFGMLEWYESDQSDKRMLAPLLLYPITLERKLSQGKYCYTITSLNEDPEENFTLRERLLRDFGIVLPKFGVDSGNASDEPIAETPEHYFEQVQQIIQDHPRSKIRRFLTLSLFSFGGISLFQDLKPERWPDEISIDQHPLISSIFCGTGEASQETIAPDYQVDEPSIASKIPLLITDADASQFSAIVDAIDGKNLVIEGPPGTGKSQTITNLISVALAKGKKVLFVAEKKAALDVVYNRLSNAGLENYCLEVHSTARSRKAFYEGLKPRIEQEVPPDVFQELQDRIQNCSEMKQALSRYVGLLNQPFGRTGKTIQELLWSGKRAEDLVTDISLPPSLQDSQAISMTNTDFQRKCQHLQVFSQQHQQLLQNHKSISHHPWYGLSTENLSPIDQDDLLGNLRLWLQSLKQLQTYSFETTELLGIAQLSTIVELSQLQQQFAQCPGVTSLVELPLLPVLKTVPIQNSVQTLISQIKIYRKRKAVVQTYFEVELITLPDVSELKTLLGRFEAIDAIKNDWTIDNLKTLGQKTAEISQKLEQYQQAVAQVANLFGLDSRLSPHDLKTISIAVQILNKQSQETLARRTVERCNPVNRTALTQGQATSKTLKTKREALAQEYNLPHYDSIHQLRSYAKTLRSANILKYFFDPDYKQAKNTWKNIQRIQQNISDSNIAQNFNRISDFLQALEDYIFNENLRRISGDLFKELETDFESLLLVNNFGTELHQKLASRSQGQRIREFLIEEDINKIEKIRLLHESKKFKALLQWVQTLNSDPEFDEHKNWEELKTFYQELSTLSRQTHDELKQFGLKSNTSLSAISGLLENLEYLHQFKTQMTTSEAIQILGYFYQEENTDIERLEATNDFAKLVLQAQFSQEIQDKIFTVNAVRIVELIQNTSQNLSQLLVQEAQYRQTFCNQGKPDLTAMFGSQCLITIALNQMINRIEHAISASQELPIWVNYNRAYQQVINDGLQALIEGFEQNYLPMDKLEDVYKVIFYRSLLRLAYNQHPQLKQFSGIHQAQVRERFQQEDKALLALYQQQLVAQLAQVYIEPGNNRGRKSEWTELSLIRNEVNKQTRHISPRALFQRASVALQQLKPCWMMSPASVAQFITPGAVGFDMVIIDEASQMRPEEALGSIARSKQLIVVGDPKQLPPTDFFKASVEDNSEENLGDEELDESILDMSLKVFYPARRLKWHYRSRHESLIAFSNEKFYDNSLTIFPSPNNQFAVEYHYIENGAYKASANVPEAMKVAQAAANFMREYPNLSLGIVTLNQKQQELLLDEMDRLFALNPELEEYRLARENTLEPFFVKNLENVQGDERDVIFISTVYGPERPGMPVMQRFGPINLRNGHRRLNVLFTRAKEKVIVFSSMKSTEIQPSPTAHRGIRVLKDYLEYAQTKQLQTAVVSGREPDSDFEVFVAERLRQQGYQVVPQVGVSGYFIDLAVIHPQKPGTYLLGIECDGATYHSSKAARDRDRLRQEVLERLGWRLYRIWSTDWFSNATAETQKLTDYLQHCCME